MIQIHVPAIRDLHGSKHFCKIHCGLMGMRQWARHGNTARADRFLIPGAYCFLGAVHPIPINLDLLPYKASPGCTFDRPLQHISEICQEQYIAGAYISVREFWSPRGDLAMAFYRALFLIYFVLDNFKVRGEWSSQVFYFACICIIYAYTFISTCLCLHFFDRDFFLFLADH